MDPDAIVLEKWGDTIQNETKELTPMASSGRIHLCKSEMEKFVQEKIELLQQEVAQLIGNGSLQEVNQRLYSFDGTGTMHVDDWLTQVKKCTIADGATLNQCLKVVTLHLTGQAQFW